MYEQVVLKPISELTKGNNMCNADAHTVRLRQKTMAYGLFQLPITLLFFGQKHSVGTRFLSWNEWNTL